VLGRWSFQQVHTTSAEYFGRFYGPLLFVFTSLSLILSALQTEMAVEQVLSQWGSSRPDGTGGLEPWTRFWVLTRWAAVLSFVVISLATLLMAGLLVSLHGREWSYAVKDKLRKRRKHRSAKFDE